MLLLLISLWAPAFATKPSYLVASSPLEQAHFSFPRLDEEVWNDMVKFDFSARSARLGVQYKKERRQKKYALPTEDMPFDFAPVTRNPGRNLLTTACGSYTCPDNNADCCYSRETCCSENTTCCNGKCCLQPYFCVSGTTCCSNEYSEYNDALVRHNSTHCGGCAPMGSGCCERVGTVCGGWGTVNGTEVFRNYTQCCPGDEYCADPGDTCCNHTKVGYLGSLHTCKGANGEQVCCQGHYGLLGYNYGLDCCDSNTETCCGGFCCPKPEQCCPDRQTIRLNETWYGRLLCQANIDAGIGILVNSMIGEGDNLDLAGEVAIECLNCSTSFNCNGTGTWTGTYSQKMRQVIVNSLVWETSPAPPSQCFSPASMSYGEDHGPLVPYIPSSSACQTTFFSYRKPVCCGVGATCCGGWCCNGTTPICCGDGQCCPPAPLAVPPPVGAIVGGLIAALAIVLLLLFCVRAYRAAPRVERGKQKVVVRRLKPRPEKVAPPAPSPIVTKPEEVSVPEPQPEPPKFEEVTPPYEEVSAPVPQETVAEEVPAPVPVATSPKKKIVKKLVPVEVEVKKFQTSAMQYLGNVRAQGRGEDGLTRTVAWGEMGATPSAQKKDGAVEEVVETKVEMREVEVEEEVVEPEPEPIVFVPPPRQPTPPPVVPPPTTPEPAYEPEPEPEYEEVEEEVPVFVREVRIPCFPCFSFDMPTSRAECCRMFKGKKSSSWCCCCIRRSVRSEGARKHRSDDIQLAD